MATSSIRRDRCRCPLRRIIRWDTLPAKIEGEEGIPDLGERGHTVREGDRLGAIANIDAFESEEDHVKW